MESRRIIKSRKTIILICVLLLFNGLWYLYQQQNQWKEYDLSIAKASQLQNKYLSSLEKLSTKNQLQAINHEKEEIEKSIEHLTSKEKYVNKDINLLLGKSFILEDIERQVLHINVYHNKLERIKNQAQLMSSISIFQKEDSFSHKNIEKTLKDYRFVSDIHLSNGLNKPITDTVFDPIIQYLSIIFIIFLVLAFIEERKIGLWEKIHSTPNGRGNLAIKRVLFLLGSSFVFQIIMVTQRLLLSSALYGNPNVFRSIQSIPEFVKFIYPINILEYLVLYCILCGICCFCFGLLAWLLLSIFHSPIMSIFVLSICTAFEWIIYFFNPLQSFFSAFKYVNFYFFINPTKEIAEYCNINLFGLVVNRLLVIFIASILLSLGFSFFMIMLSNRIKPIRIPGILDRIWKKCVLFCGNIWRKFLSKRSDFFFELYKTFGTYKGYLILFVMIIYLLSSFESFQLMFSTDEIVQNKFYKEYGGPIKGKNLQKFQELQKQAGKIEIEVQEVEDAYSNQTITADQYNEKKNAFKKDLGALTLAGKLNQDYQRLKGIKEKNNITPWFNNTMGPEVMLSKETERNRLNRIQLSVLIMILLISFSYSQEKKSAVKDKLRTTVNGREKLFRKKLLSNVLICFLITGIIWVYDYVYYAKIFPMGSLFAPIQTLNTLDYIPFRCNILTFLILLFLVRWVLLCCISFFVSFLSSKFTTVATIIISFLIFLIPSLLAIIGIRLFKSIAVIDSMTLIRSITQRQYALDLKLKLLAVLILGIAGVILCYQQWCKKGVGYETRH